ncbi:hypothetical protein INT44_001556 [Umbelopsis vinacea]|uniref:DUF676 domain-containing protein n=1 Tax=Umbelopsis vinacea TaxID=44442 RepID=A0A8H7UGI8_9FUNG|nr:hypothetical protein INT44_001556 [Umbelopsis vinacea]
MAAKKELQDRDQILMVFVHGFRGSEASFLDFPERVRTMLTNSMQMDVDAVIYPSYKTQGNLKQAVDGLSDWLLEETQTREAEIKRLGGKGQLLVVLAAHSMGGIVSAEAILRFQPQDIESQTSSYSLSRTKPNIVGLIAFDTPFYSLNHSVVSSPAWDRFQQVNRHVSTGYDIMNALLPATAATATAAAGTKRITETANTTASKGGWGRFAGVALGVAGAAAVAAAAYTQRERVSGSVSYLLEHLQFVSALANSSECRSRQKPEKPDSPRTFIANPPEDKKEFFEAAEASASDPISAHTGMFDPQTNSNCYALGISTASLITEMVNRFEQWRDSQTD